MTEDVAGKAEPQMEYAMEQIVGHNGHGRRRRYIVRLYRYELKDDLLEPVSSIPKHFIARYVEREICKQARGKLYTKK